MSDNQAREKIITNVDKNYFVEAGAGSGKTTILVERMVAMVEQGFPIDKICTITFTKAAANEFYERFQKRLSERSRPENNKEMHPGRLDKQTDQTMKNCREALQYIDTAFMGTIDAFCNMILSEHPLEAGIPANSKVVEDEKIVDLYLKEYSKIESSEEYRDLRDKYKVFVQTQGRHYDVFKSVVEVIIKIRDAEFVYEKPDYSGIEKKYAVDKKDLVKLFNKLLANKDLIYIGNKDSIAAWDLLDKRKTFAIESDWDNNFAQVLDTLKQYSSIGIKPVDDLETYIGASANKFTPNFKTKRYAHYGLSKDGYLDIVEELKDYQARVALDFVIDCVKKMSEVLRKQGSLTYFDYKLYLRDMLKSDALGNHKLINHIYDRHQYFLIDEFQDTDPMQAEIFFYLAADVFDADWRKCKPKPGSLFIVGDPKQSIYRFKNADVASFKNVRSLFTGDSGEVLNLTSNFRSTRTLHEWFNKVFGEHLLSLDTEDQSKYEPINNKDKDDDYCTGIYKFTLAEKKNDVQEVLNIISTLVDNPNILIGDNTRIQYKDIMLITSKKALLQQYINAFTDYHIPFKVEGDIDFNECQALKDLVAVYRAAVYPSNNMYVYGALISSIYDISPRNIMDIKDDIKGLKYEGQFNPSDPGVIEAVESLKHYHDESRQMCASALFEKLIDELRLFEHSGNHNQDYVYYALELIREREANGEIASCEDALPYFDKWMSTKSGLERCAAFERNDNRIHLANLHKVKGLEAPVVILAGSLGQKPSVRADRRVEYVGDVPKCFTFNIDNKLIFSDKYGKKEKEKASVEAERVRQLYVAATRAGRILVISDSQPWMDLSTHVEQDFFSSFAMVPISKTSLTEVDAKRLYDNAESVIKNNSDSMKQSIEIKRPSDIAYEKVREDVTAYNTKRNPELIGTLVHRYMEVVISSRNNVDKDELISDLCRGLDVNDTYYSDMLKKVNDRIQNGGYNQTNGMPADILNELLIADEVYCEVSFSRSNGNNTITTGIIDVLYRKGDEWHIVDYKTNTDGNNLTQHYQSQLAEYIKAASDQLGILVSAYIYHITIV